MMSATTDSDVSWERSTVVDVPEPKADRPHAPGYFAQDTEGVLPWSWAVDLLNRVRNSVISTVRQDGRVHAMPIWGLWFADGYCLSTAITSVKSVNLQANPNCVITVGDGDDAVVLEGRAELIEVPDGLREAYRDKYEEAFPEGPIWIVRPRVAFAFQATDDFAKTATRWTF